MANVEETEREAILYGGDSSPAAAAVPPVIDRQQHSDFVLSRNQVDNMSHSTRNKRNHGLCRCKMRCTLSLGRRPKLRLKPQIQWRRKPE